MSIVWRDARKIHDQHIGISVVRGAIGLDGKPVGLLFPHAAKSHSASSGAVAAAKSNNGRPGRIERRIDKSQGIRSKAFDNDNFYVAGRAGQITIADDQFKHTRLIRSSGRETADQGSSRICPGNGNARA